MKGTLDCVNWPGKFPDKPYVAFELENCGDHLHLHFIVREELTKAAATKDFDAVWNDSCCEFFVKFNDEPKYYNLETSCNGRQLLMWRTDRNDPENAPQEVLDKIKKVTSIKYGEVFDEKHIAEWTLDMEIPAEAFWHSGLKSFDGIKASGNFYKCNSGMARQHYITWAPITTPSPDYHRPEFFQPLDI